MYRCKLHCSCSSEMNAVVLLVHKPLHRPPHIWHSFKNNFLWSFSSLDCTQGMFQIYPQIFTDVHDRLLWLMLPEVSSCWILEVCCCRRQTQDICIHSLQESFLSSFCSQLWWLLPKSFYSAQTSPQQFPKGADVALQITDVRGGLQGRISLWWQCVQKMLRRFTPLANLMLGGNFQRTKVSHMKNKRVTSSAYYSTYRLLGERSTGTLQVTSGDGGTGLTGGFMGELCRVNWRVDCMPEEVVQTPVCPIVWSGTDTEEIWRRRDKKEEIVQCIDSQPGVWAH